LAHNERAPTLPPRRPFIPSSRTLEALRRPTLPWGVSLTGPPRPLDESRLDPTRAATDTQAVTPKSLREPLVEAAWRGAWAPVLVFGVHVPLSRFGIDVYDDYPLVDVPMHLAGG